MEFKMKLVYRNYLKVRDAATAVGEGAPNAMHMCFTPQMVVKETGMTVNTVKKYLSEMEEDGVITKIVAAKTLTVYRFCEDYLAGFKNDRVQTAIQDGVVKNA
jgi:hypothetical protein